MQVVTTVEQLRQVVAEQKKLGKRIAFVPTMGNLHQGHLQLVKLARSKAEFVIASIFVNPMQFGQGEDFEKYPRTHDQDKQKLIAEGCQLLFLPSVKTMYPVPANQQTRVEVPGLSDILCGQSRPGHFVGVSTIVCKLFNLVQPDIAVFGEKDFQQLMVIRRMVKELCMPVMIIGAPIVREADGLAMSSRNGYLDEEQRMLAPLLFKALNKLKIRLETGDKNFIELEKQLTEQLNQSGFNTDYIAIRSAIDLQQPGENDRQLVILAAAFVGKTRLIDNLLVTQ